LVGGKVKANDIDIIFKKVIPKGKNVADKKCFIAGVHAVAERKWPNKSPDEAFAACMKKMRKGKVKTTGTTKTDKVALHDDKSLHTGVYGREVEDDNTVSDASKLVDRNAKADARGVVGGGSKKKKGKGKKKKEEKEEEEEDDGIDLEEKEVKDILTKCFEDFSSQGKSKKKGDGAGQISGRQFTKCMKDSKIIGGGVVANDCDIVWSKCAKGKSKADYDCFCEAVKAVSAKRYPNKDPKRAFSICVKKMGKATVSTTGTTETDNVELHDDPSNYTGVYKEGGGKSVTNEEATSNAASLCDRDRKANARGVVE